MSRQTQRKRYPRHFRRFGRALCLKKGARKITTLEQLVTCPACLELLAKGTR